jgi:hypothetical protein
MAASMVAASLSCCIPTVLQPAPGVIGAMKPRHIARALLVSAVVAVVATMAPSPAAAGTYRPYATTHVKQSADPTACISSDG